MIEPNPIVGWILFGIIVVFFAALWLNGQTERARNRRINGRNIAKWKTQDDVWHDRNIRKIRADQQRLREERHTQARAWAAAQRKAKHDAQRRAAQDMARWQREHPNPNRRGNVR